MSEEIPSIPTSVKYYYDLDLGTNQLLNARLHPVTTAERIALASSYNSADEGVVVYDSTLDTFFAWNGNTWLQIGITQSDLHKIGEAYDRSVMSVDVTSTNTDRTITLNYRDATFTADVYKYAHIHNQPSASAQWTITHNLGKFPSVSVVDSANNEVIGEVEYVTDTQLVIKFSAPFSGKAFFN
jgi:hypothetical protein